MRSKLTWLGLAVAAVGIGVISPLAVGQTSSEPSPTAVSTSAKAGHADRPLRRLLWGNIGRLLTMRAELGITDAQREQIHIVVRGHKNEFLTLASQVIEKREALREQILADQPDEAAIRKAADDLGKSIGDAAVLAAKVAGEVRPILTPEQIERIKKFHAEKAAGTGSLLKGVLAK